MRLVAVMLAAGVVAGCQAIEVNQSMSAGLLRAEPHPLHADSVRIVTMDSRVLMDTLGRGTPEGARTVVTQMLGEECANAQIIEEGRIRLRLGVSGRTEHAALRVICPAARVR